MNSQVFVSSAKEMRVMVSLIRIAATTPILSFFLGAIIQPGQLTTVQPHPFGSHHYSPIQVNSTDPPYDFLLYLRYLISHIWTCAAQRAFNLSTLRYEVGAPHQLCRKGSWLGPVSVCPNLMLEEWSQASRTRHTSHHHLSGTSRGYSLT